MIHGTLHANQWNRLFSSTLNPNSAVSGDYSESRDEPSGTKAIGFWLIVACMLQCFGGRSKKLPAQNQLPKTPLKLFASVPSLLHVRPLITLQVSFSTAESLLNHAKVY